MDIEDVPKSFIYILESSGFVCDEKATISAWLTVLTDLAKDTSIYEDEVDELYCNIKVDTWTHGLVQDLIAKLVVNMPYWPTNGDSKFYKKEFFERMEKAGFSRTEKEI